jgi:bacteriophage HK97-gp10 putative tail-component
MARPLMPATYKVINPGALRMAADPLIGYVAERIKDEVTAATPKGPTGDLAASWAIETGKAPAVRIIHNPEPYAAFVEYGTRNMHAEPFLGPVIARWRT